MARILVVSFSVCPAPDRDGAELSNLLKALGSRHLVDALAVRGEGQPFVERMHRARMLRVPVGSGPVSSRIEAFRRAVRRQLEGAECDVVHLRGLFAAGVVLANLPAGARLCYEPACEGPLGAITEPADAAETSTVLAATLASDETACLARAELVLVRSAPAAQALAKTGLGERVQVVPPGVDVDRFDWEPAEENDGQGPLRLVSVGRVGPGRGIELLLSAAASLASHRAVRLSLVGVVEPAFVSSLAPRIAETPSLAVEILGAIEPEDMPRVYAAADVCVVPALPAQPALPDCPLALLEAMACRRAIAAPRREEISEVIADGEGGLLFSPDDAGDLARVLGTLAADGGRRAALADAGYARVRRLYTAAAVRRRLLEAYARLIPPSAWLPPQALFAAAGEVVRGLHGVAAVVDAPDAPDAPDVTDRDLVIAPPTTPDETPLPFAPGPAEPVARPDIVEVVDPDTTVGSRPESAPPSGKNTVD